MVVAMLRPAPPRTTGAAHGMAARSPTRRAVLALALLSILAFGVRMVGIDFGVPLWEEGDSYFPGHVELLRKDKVLSKRTSDNVQYPSLIPHCVALWPARPAPGEGATLDQHLHSARGDFVQVRIFVALLGVLTIPLTYRLARRTSGRAWAYFAACLPAVSLLHLNFSQQARPHAALATLFLATVLACLRLRRRPTTGAYLLAGLLTALSVGCLHSGLMMVLPLLAAHLLAERPAGRSRWLEPRLLLPAALIAASVRVFYSYAFDESLREAKQVFRIENGHVYMSTHKLSLEMWNGSGAASLLRILRDWEPQLLFLLPLALVGLVLARRRGARSPRRGEGLVLAAFLVPYLALLMAYSRTYERFLIPLLPFAAAFCAHGASRVAALLSRPARTALVGALVLALALSAWTSARWAWIRSQPDTYERAGQWVQDNVVPADSERIFLTPPFDLPLARSDEALRGEDGKLRNPGHSRWARYQARLTESERPAPLFDVRMLLLQAGFGDLTDPARMGAFLDAHGPGVYVLQVAVGRRSSRFDPVLRSVLAERGTLEARLSPDPDPYFSEHPLADEDEEVDDWPGFFWRVLRARSSGPVVEVYRVP